MTKKELFEALENNELLNYVSTNYWKWSKEQLKDIVIQLIFTMYDNNITENHIDGGELLERLDLED